jgi:hypothetical protein
MRRIWFDCDEPPVLDHRLTATAGNAQRTKSSNAAALCGHLRYLSNDGARRQQSARDSGLGHQIEHFIENRPLDMLGDTPPSQVVTPKAVLFV